MTWSCRRYEDVDDEGIQVVGLVRFIHIIISISFKNDFVQASAQEVADTLSAARPGARRELLEAYIKRLEKLEEIANGYEGVAKAFALQAGREIRIIVESQKISDEKAVLAAKDIATKIKDELEYPGKIKVTVIREMRAVEYAR